ncbi:helix-turn-helix domain-containing protein [Chitinophaga sp. SYP-B3965]|uniref:AraC family transcriptional regulator n=1 Tax=Chitinophaga sp. SYP-B3965 TaxID=2663120 RepID=UPI001299CB44|nr:AraC family transcriptional regulator [Chitinophaga sp. SYP-B3965]MRG44716.1 helix-turn-helix domain-containing protein [Chitinophaga sp. SYP-B3965]
MEEPQLLSTGKVFFSVVIEKYYSKEMLVKEHTLLRIVSGEMKLIMADSSYVLHGGDTILFPRNTLAMITKSPLNGEPYKAASVYFPPEVLRKYYASHPVTPAQEQEIPRIRVLDQHPLLDSLFGSMLPYFTMSEELPADIVTGKVEEAISILRTIDKTADVILSHFEEPGKIDLADFMEKNYMFNMPMEKFSYLTGRSLTTFKRDFKRSFNTTPQKWLTQKRLELAHHQIFEQKRRPSDVYFEVGFENLSHFSFAFKKQFGYNPSNTMLRH